MKLVSLRFLKLMYKVINDKVNVSGINVSYIFMYGFSIQVEQEFLITKTLLTAKLKKMNKDQTMYFLLFSFTHGISSPKIRHVFILLKIF